MRSRFTWILAAIFSMAVAATALADHHEGKGQGKGKSYEKAMQRADENAERAEDARDAAEERAEQTREVAKERAKEARERGETAADDASAGRGAEMRDRRDERKAIMEEAKSAAEPGTPRKGKKPWWRFWESDEESAAE